MRIDPFFGSFEPADRAQQRRLAGTVGTEHRGDLAGLGDEGDVAQRLHRAEGDREVLDRDHSSTPR